MGSKRSSGGGRWSSKRENEWRRGKGSRCVVDAPSPYRCSAPRKNVGWDCHWTRRRVSEVGGWMAMFLVWQSLIESVLKRGAPVEVELFAERGGYGRYSGVEAVARGWSVQ